MSETTTEPLPYDVGSAPTDEVWLRLQTMLEAASYPGALALAVDLHKRHENLREERRRTEEQRLIAVRDLETANTERAAAQHGLDVANRALRNFKRTVRDLAIATHKDEGWCLDGLNAALKSLGLEEYVPVTEFTVTVKETAVREGTIVVEVDRTRYVSDSEAEARAREMAYSKWENDSTDIDWDSWDDHEAKDSDDWEVQE